MLEKLQAANRVLKDNGVESDEAAGVLIALCECLGVDVDFNEKQYDVLFE